MREWFTTKEIAALKLPDLPSTRQGIEKLAKSQGWPLMNGKTRKRAGRGGGLEFHVSLLPQSAQLRLKIAASRQAEHEQPKSELWTRFEGLSKAHKQTCEARLKAVVSAFDMEAAGLQTTAAMSLAASQAGVSLATLYNWRGLVAKHDRQDWLAALAPSFVNTAKRSDCHPAAWDYFVSDYLRPGEPSLSGCYERMEDTAKKEGWSPIPSERAIRRRVQAEIPEAVIVFAREGKDKAKTLYPAQKRIRHDLHAMQAVNMDGHKLDVFVSVPWSDKPVRMILIALQDLYSAKFVAWRLADAETWEAVRLTIGDMVERYGIPDQIVMDNGRAFTSKWISGQTSNRFRFKVKPEDPKGLLTTLGVQIHWTQPYSGQSKPIERAFRIVADRISKHPICAGAYTGNRPDAKPEDYGTRAVPLEEFRRHVDAQIIRMNAKQGRKNKPWDGRSYDEAFTASLNEPTTIVRWPSEEQRTLWLMASEVVTAQRGSGEIHFQGNRYWDRALNQWAGRKVTLRFDPDNLHKPLRVYSLDNELICQADCIDDTGFFDQDASRRHNRARADYLKGLRQTADAERKLSAQQLGEIYYRGQEVKPPVPEKPAVTRIATGNRAIAAKLEEESTNEIDFEANLERALRLIQGGLED